ncbi:MAG: NADH-quinone oxidoreductase subunit NuoN [Alphaproteobacteria bacterium]|nr:NADH-quinone oxidoreductase subunit NuoN [Alphaproteobacteria bacterium]
MINLTPVIPELVLACGGMALLMIGVFRGDGAMRSVAWISVLVLVVAGIASGTLSSDRQVVFGGQFVTDAFAQFAKWLVVIGAVFGIAMSLSYNERHEVARFEFPVLIVFATLGMFMMISANDLISLYVGLELQSLSLYVLAAFRRDNLRSSEAGLKYFVLGALSSGMLLYGASLVYGFAGSTGFDALAGVFKTGSGPSIGLIVGMVFVIAGLAFKISAVPFHMWTPDVYEGAPTPVTAFFALAPKIAAFALFMRVLTGPFGPLVAEWQQIVWLLAIASMILGALAAIWQSNIKRLLAYSSIGHVGYALVGLAAGNETGVRGVLIYLAIYLAMSAGAFCCVLAMRRGNRMVEGIDDLAGLSRTQPMVALAMAVLMFSMAGIPPLAGFFGKLYVFLAAVQAGLYALAVIGVLASVIGAYYYLRIIKIMYFDEPAESMDRPVGREIGAIMAASTLFIVLFFVYPSPILNGAQTAAAALFAG